MNLCGSYEIAALSRSISYKAENILGVHDHLCKGIPT